MEKRRMITEKQKEYQKRYDKKTKMISVKYNKSDMNDYHRLKEYLKRTGKSTNSFVKELINDFFEHEKYEINDRRIAEYFMNYNVDEELLVKLKKTVGKKKFDLIMEHYKDSIESELYWSYMDKGEGFDEWVEQFLEDIECGDIDINIPDAEFSKLINRSISNNIGDVTYYC